MEPQEADVQDVRGQRRRDTKVLSNYFGPNKSHVYQVCLGHVTKQKQYIFTELKTFSSQNWVVVQVIIFI